MGVGVGLRVIQHLPCRACDCPSPLWSCMNLQVLKSSTYWMIVYFWRLANPHSVMQFILVAILYNKVFEYLYAVQYLGYVPIGLTGLMAYGYGKYVMEFLST